jgi:hypothetical protein
MTCDIIRRWSENIDKRKSAPEARRGRQARVPSGHRHAQRQTAGSQGSTISCWQFFRPARPAAGSLRNGAAASRRGRTGGEYSTAVWGLSSNSLPGADRLQSRWACRSAAQTAWAEARAQADAGDPVAHRAASARAAQLASWRSATRIAAHVWPHHSSPKPRATAQCQKKTSQRLNPTDCFGDALGYEKLRSATLSGTTAEGAAGLGVLLRRGLAAWLTVAPSKPAPLLDMPKSARVPSPLPAALASIVLRLTKEATHA